MIPHSEWVGLAVTAIGLVALGLILVWDSKHWRQ
jgi:hypothetical protein